MKITITEAQYQKLLEGNITYAPEKIDDFVEEAQQFLNNARALKNKYYMNVTTLNISDVMENEVGFQKLAEKMDSDHNVIEQKHNRYADIVNMYDFMEEPENVKYLGKLSDRIYDVSDDIYQLSQALEEIVSSVRYLRRMSDDKK